LGIILLCYQYINLLWPMYSCEIWADADPFCAGADPCIRNLLDIHIMYWQSYYYVTNILIFCGRGIAVKFGQMPIHASEFWSDIHDTCWESYYYNILPIYYFAVADNSCLQNLLHIEGAYLWLYKCSRLFSFSWLFQIMLPIFFQSALSN